MSSGRIVNLEVVRGIEPLVLGLYTTTTIIIIIESNESMGYGVSVLHCMAPTGQKQKPAVY